MTLVVIAALCLIHALVRIGSGLVSLPSELPRAQTAPFDWLEEHVRGEQSVGFVTLGDLNNHEHSWFRSTVQASIAPTRLVYGRRPMTVILRSPEMRPRESLDHANALGLPHHLNPPDKRITLACESTPVPRLAEPPNIPTAPLGAQLVTLSLLLAPAFVLGVARGGPAIGWYLLTAPVALALVSAIADAFGGTRALLVALTCVIVATLMRLIWAMERSRRDRSWVTIAVVAAGTLLFALAAFDQPFGMLDAQSMYNLRARLILVDDGFWAPFVGESDWYVEHADYPPLISFAVAGTWRLAGGVHDVVPPVLAYVIWLAAGLVLSGWARRLGRLYEVTALSMWLLSPFVISTAADQVCDVPLAAFAGCAWLAWLDVLRGVRKGQRTWPSLAFAATATAAAVWTKNEGLVLVLALGVCSAPGALRSRGGERAAWLRLALFLLPAVILYLLFKVEVPSNDLVQGATWRSASLDRVRMIATSMAHALTWPTLFKGVFIAAAVWFALAWRSGDTRSDRELGAAIALFLSAVAVVYLVTPHDLDWHLRTSLSRVVVQPHLLAIVLLLSTIARVEGGSRSESGS